MVATVRCAPPDNRPSTVERDTCAPWVNREVGLLAPHVTYSLGFDFPDAKQRVPLAEVASVTPIDFGKDRRSGQLREALAPAPRPHSSVPDRPGPAGTGQARAGRRGVIDIPVT